VEGGGGETGVVEGGTWIKSSLRDRGEEVGREGGGAWGE
jgi:hypothetical protein